MDAKIAGVTGLWIIDLEGHGPQDTGAPTTSSPAGYDYFESPQWRPNGQELSSSEPGWPWTVRAGVLVQTDGTGLRAIVNRPLGPGRSPRCHRTGIRSRIPCCGDRSRPDSCRRRRHRRRSGSRLRRSRRRCPPHGRRTAPSSSSNGPGSWRQLMVGSVDGGPVTAIGPTRPDIDRRRRGPVLARRLRMIALYSPTRIDVAAGPGRRSRHQAATTTPRAPELAAAPGALTSTYPGLAERPACTVQRAGRPLRMPARMMKPEAAGRDAILSERGHLSRAIA